MANGKVVVLTRGLDKDQKDVFMAAMPAGWNRLTRYLFLGCESVVIVCGYI